MNSGHVSAGHALRRPAPRARELPACDVAIGRRVTDAQVISASLDTPQSFEAIFDRHFQRISRYLRRRLSPAVADDVAAEVFATAFARRQSYDVSRPDALPWLFGIAANLVRRHVRDEHRELAAYTLSGLVLEPAADTEPVDGMLDRELESAIAEALMRLHAADREALLLFAWANLSYVEIATALEVPVGTVRSRLNRARGQVARALAPHMEATKEAVHE